MTQEANTATRRLAKRMTPSAREVAAGGLERIADGITSLPRYALKNEPEFGMLYQGLIQFTATGALGEAAKVIDWSMPPVVGTAERRYLVVLDKLARAIGVGDTKQTRRAVLGITAYKGSRADSGGSPCHPELLALTGLTIESTRSLLESNGLNPTDVVGCMKMSDRLYTVIENYSAGEADRTLLGAALIRFQEVVLEREAARIPIGERLINSAISFGSWVKKQI